MSWGRRKPELTTADLDRVERHMDSAVKEVERRLLATLRPPPTRFRATVAAAVMATVIAVVSGMLSYVASWAGQSVTPTAAAPGQIAVAILGDAGSSQPVQVDGNFDANSPSEHGNHWNRAAD